jgi:hypothetical protein
MGTVQGPHRSLSGSPSAPGRPAAARRPPWLHLRSEVGAVGPGSRPGQAATISPALTLPRSTALGQRQSRGWAGADGPDRGEARVRHQRRRTAPSSQKQASARAVIKPERGRGCPSQRGQGRDRAPTRTHESVELNATQRPGPVVQNAPCRAGASAGGPVLSAGRLCTQRGLMTSRQRLRCC